MLLFLASGFAVNKHNSTSIRELSPNQTYLNSFSSFFSSPTGKYNSVQDKRNFKTPGRFANVKSQYVGTSRVLVKQPAMPLTLFQ